jgi:hypothetical protein
VTPERSRSMQPFQVEKPRRPCDKGITRWENLAIHDLPLRKTMKEVFGAFSQGEFKKLIPTGLEKPLQVINPYDKTTDSDEQVKNIEAILNYHNVIGAVKCKMFATTLRKRAMLYKSVKRESIDSWKELCRHFTAYFTPS